MDEELKPKKVQNTMGDMKSPLLTRPISSATTATAIKPVLTRPTASATFGTTTKPMGTMGIGGIKPAMVTPTATASVPTKSPITRPLMTKPLAKPQSTQPKQPIKPAVPGTTKKVAVSSRQERLKQSRARILARRQANILAKKGRK